MRAIFVNHCHPDCPHVCGTRAREFARALARQGHQIVLLTESLKRCDPAQDVKTLGEAIERHDWRTPFCLAVSPRRAPLLEAVRAGRLPRWLRGAVISYQYLVRGGMFTDWRDASRPYWEPLAEAFRPDVVWGVFGNTDAWAIAQGIARAAGCPWVRDVKDQWTAFIPPPFRRPLANRFSDATHSTALSRANATNIQPWFSGAATVVYSGVSAELLRALPSRDVAAPFAVTLVGAVYGRSALEIFFAGWRRFLETTGDRSVVLNYAGTDGQAVTMAASRAGVSIHVHGQLPYSSYWALVTRSDLNVYLRTVEIGWWHHKIVELLAARRPILCVPGEIGEALELAQLGSGRLLNAADPAVVAEAIEGAWRLVRTGGMVDPAVSVAALTWDALAASLIEVLSSAAAPRNMSEGKP